MKRFAATVALALILSGCGMRPSAAPAPLDPQLTRLQQENQELARHLAEANAARAAGEQPPGIESIGFRTAQGEPLPTEGGWVRLADQTRIAVKLSGRTTQVDVIYTPTGTGTYSLQRIIGSVTVAPGQQEATIQWEVPDETHGHLWVMAYSGRIARRSEPVNVHR